MPFSTAFWRKLTVLCAMLTFSYTSFAQETPNFIIFIADDVGWNDLGCYGNEVVQSPNMDQLAAEGIRFNKAFLTTSSCSPSRNSIITGRYPHNTGAAELHTSPPLDMQAFPKLLKEKGYYNVLAGKSHMGEFAYREFDQVLDDGSKFGDGGEAQWVQVVEERPKDQPFFFWFAGIDAHRIWGENEFSGTHDPNDITPPPFLPDGPLTRADLAKYYDEIKRFDHYIGEVRKVLEAQNALENTVIIVMSDNGRPFSRCKTRLYDSGIQTPFIVRWGEGIEAPAECNSLLSVIDIAPTILDLAKAEIPESIQGQSFRKLLENSAQPFREYVFGEHNWHDFEAHERSVRTDDFLYIRNYRPQFANQGPLDAVNSDTHKELLALKEAGQLSPAQADMFSTPRPHEELYDCKNDPLQLVNLAAKPEYQAQLKELRATLNQWMMDTADSVPALLTQDWYHRVTGATLEQRGVRGTMPGSDKQATQVNAKGAF